MKLASIPNWMVAKRSPPKSYGVLIFVGYGGTRRDKLWIPITWPLKILLKNDSVPSLPSDWQTYPHSALTRQFWSALVLSIWSWKWVHSGYFLDRGKFCCTSSSSTDHHTACGESPVSLLKPLTMCWGLWFDFSRNSSNWVALHLLAGRMGK